MADEIRNGCDGHCEKCSINQRSYCAAQLAYYNMQEIMAIRADLAKKNQDSELTLISNGDMPSEAINTNEENNNAILPCV